MSSKTMCHAFQDMAASDPDALAIQELAHEGAVWRTRESRTWAQYADHVRRGAGALHELGVRRGETVALMLTNRAEFHEADAAAMHLGAATMSLYNTAPQEALRHCLKDSGSRVVITEALFASRIAEAAVGTGVLEIVVVDRADEAQLSWQELLASTPDWDGFDAAWRAVTPDDVLTVIYTSGTTGTPKGVELTHGGMAQLVPSIDRRASFRRRGRVVSYLPMAHIAERLASQYKPMFLGFEVTCCPDASDLLPLLPIVRPHFFFAPPRPYEKVRSAVLDSIDKVLTEKDAAEAKLHFERTRDHRLGEIPVPSSVRLLARLVGLDKVTVGFIGAAPANDDLIGFFHALGIPLGENYGLSEASGAVAVPSMANLRLGTAGQPLDCVEIRQLADGELLVRSPAVMRGYRNLPQATAAAVDEDGWLHTGDIVEVDEDSFLRVVDRLNELIINSSGKNMSPAHIEAVVESASDVIVKACCIGDGRPYNIAILVISGDDRGGAYASSERHDAIAQAIAEANAHLARAEQIKDVIILRDEWIPGGDELTITGKLRRRAIAEKYAAEIDGAYDRSAREWAAR